MDFLMLRATLLFAKEEPLTLSEAENLDTQEQYNTNTHVHRVRHCHPVTTRNGSQGGVQACAGLTS